MTVNKVLLRISWEKTRQAQVENAIYAHCPSNHGSASLPGSTEMVARNALSSFIQETYFDGCRYTGAALAQRASQSFGYLNRQGYGGHRFPIVIGETGSFFTSAQAADLAFFRDFALYLRNEQYMNDGLHNSIDSVFWW